MLPLNAYIQSCLFIKHIREKKEVLVPSTYCSSAQTFYPQNKYSYHLDICPCEQCHCYTRQCLCVIKKNVPLPLEDAALLQRRIDYQNINWILPPFNPSARLLSSEHQLYSYMEDQLGNYDNFNNFFIVSQSSMKPFKMTANFRLHLCANP